ncbi:MAG: hypothetical protein KC731_03855 [Myxococcales bacterium]|nr:hypothetical protein [Myxococcales bacterium]
MIRSALRAAGLSTLALVGLLGGGVAAADALLPSGWRAGPKRPSEAEPPSCCGRDALCCTRAKAKHGPGVALRVPPSVSFVDELPLVELPLEPHPLPASRRPRVLDGNGRPLARLDIPPREGEDIRLVPRGEAGRIRVGTRDMFWGNEMAFYSDPDKRMLGQGVSFRWSSNIPRRLAIRWDAYRLDDEGRLTFDWVEGRFDRFRGDLVADVDVEVVPKPLLSHHVYAFRARRGSEEEVHLVTPVGGLVYRDPRSERLELSVMNAPFEHIRLPLDGAARSVGIALHGVETLPPSREAATSGVVQVSVTSNRDRPRLLVSVSAE